MCRRPAAPKNWSVISEPTEMTDFREELAWAAGFFDGEGHVGYSHLEHRHRQIYLVVTQKPPELLHRFRAAVGGRIGRVYSPGKVSGAHRYATAGFEGVQAVVGMLWFKLGDVKREQARAALLGWRNSPGRQWTRIDIGATPSDGPGSRQEMIEIWRGFSDKKAP